MDFFAKEDKDHIPLSSWFQLGRLLVFFAATFIILGLTSNMTMAEEETSTSLDLCALERDYSFFTGTPARSQANIVPGSPQAQILTCEDIMRLGENIASLMAENDVPAANLDLENELIPLLGDYPIAVMARAISSYDREIAGLIVGIGKKESNWGKRTPKLFGEECYNYWGYRGQGDRGLTPDGYGCWETPEAAVKAIGDRLVTLREQRSSSTPERMVVWKCGSSCATHSKESVAKWIADVNIYYRTIAEAPQSTTRQ